MTHPGATDGYLLGVDLGTSNTVAVMRWPDGRTRPLLFDGQPIVPSGVCLDQAGAFHVGRDAQRVAQLDPAWYEPNPKRRIDEPTVLLGDREAEVAELLAAILRVVAAKAVEVAGFLPPAALTYPATWGEPRRATLVEAARRAGWPEPLLIPEPVAAARYYTDVLQRPLPVGASLAVVDFGGGTLDVAVVRNDGAALTVIGAGGLGDLGGLDLDAAIIEHLGPLPPPLTAPRDVGERRLRQLLWDDVRGAKEMLSRAPLAPLSLPGVERAVHVTREELERLVTPLMRRAVAETAQVIGRCGLQPYQLAGLFLVGGASRVPLLARMLHAELGVAPIVLDQPELPVPEGALAMLSAVVRPAERLPEPSPADDATPTVRLGPAPRPWWRRRSSLVAAVAAVVVLALVAGTVLYVRRNPYAAADFQVGGLAEVKGDQLKIPTDAAGSSRYAVADGDTAYFTYQVGKKLHLVGVNTANGKQRWDKPVGDEHDEWTAPYVTDKVVVIAGSESGNGPRTWYVLNRNGEPQWDAEGRDWDQMWPMDGYVFHLDFVNKQLVKRSYTNGTPQWTYNIAGDSWVFWIGEEGDYRSGDETPKGLRVLVVDKDGTTTVVDVTGQKKLTSRPQLISRANAQDVPARIVTSGKWLFTAPVEAGYRIDRRDLTDLDAAPTSLYLAPSDTTLRDMRMCAPDRLCVLDAAGDSVAVRSIAVDGGQRWTKPVPGATALYRLGDQVLVRGDNTARLFDSAGEQRQHLTAARVLQIAPASVLIFDKSGSDPVNAGLVGLSAGGKPADLGSASSYVSSCSADRRFLACVDKDRFRIWRFAN